MDTYNNVENEKNVKNDKKRERSFFQFQRPSADEVSKYAKSIDWLLDGVVLWNSLFGKIDKGQLN